MLLLSKYQLFFSLEVRELARRGDAATYPMAIRSSSSGNAATLGNLIVSGQVPKSAAAARGMCILALVLGEESGISMVVAD